MITQIQHSIHQKKCNKHNCHHFEKDVGLNPIVTLFFFFKESKQHVTAREISFSIKKKEEGPYWPNLLKDKKKVGFSPL